jgi:hypothetical protein
MKASTLQWPVVLKKQSNDWQAVEKVVFLWILLKFRKLANFSQESNIIENTKLNAYDLFTIQE